jgi:hypothetical protein
MDKIVRKIKGIRKTYFVYNKEEAIEEGISYKYWKDADVGEYGITDDEYVAICIGRKEYIDSQKRCRAFIKLSCGVGWGTRLSKLLYEPNRDFGLYSQVKPDYWVRKEIKSTRFKNAVTAYIGQLLSTNAIDWTAIGNIYRPDQKVPEATVRRLFKQQEVREVIDDKLKQTLLDKGVNQELVLDLHLEAIEIARKKTDPSNMLRATENLMDLLEMKPGKRVVTESMDMTLTSSIADQIESEEKRVKLEQKTEEPIAKESTNK